MTTSRLRAELVSLFGRMTAEQAERTDPASLDLSESLMAEVHAASDALLALRGHTLQQRLVVEAMRPDTRLVLCMWLSDMNLAGKLAAQTLKAGKSKGKQVNRYANIHTQPVGFVCADTTRQAR